MIETSEEPTLVANKLVEGNDEDEVPLAWWRSRHSTRALLVGMKKVARIANLTYVPTGTPSSVKVIALKVGFETGK